MAPELTYVIPCVNEGDNLRLTVDNIESSSTRSHEIVVVDNGSTDGCCDFLNNGTYSMVRLLSVNEPLGVAGARNLGAAFAEGRYLLFVDAHVIADGPWVDPLIEAIRASHVAVAAPAISAWGNTGVRGYGMHWTDAALHADWLPIKAPTTYPVPMVAGMCQAFRWELFHDLGGYDTGMVGYGHEDLEICLRSWLLGYQVVVAPQAEVSHLFRSSAPYGVAWRDVVHNLLRLAYLHFNTQRIERILAQSNRDFDLDSAIRQINKSDVWTRRRSLEVRRRHDDDWFFATFGMNV